MNYSKYKHKISFEFYSNSEDSAEDIIHDLLDILEDTDSLGISNLMPKAETHKNDYLGRGNELLKSLGINTSNVSTNKEIQEAENLSATLIHK